MEVAQQESSQFLFRIDDLSNAGEVRRFAVQLAEQIGMDDHGRGAVAIAVTEMASNIVKHAKAGTMVCDRIGHNGRQGLRIVAFDKGSGIQNIAAALEDGFSTAGTSGSGLGAVRRLSTHFDLYSLPGRGTCVLAEFWPQRKLERDSSGMSVGVVSIPIRGESVCGDGWRMKTSSDRVHLMVADGLGHGEFAAEAAREAERVLMESHEVSPGAILRDCHDALKKTRGAAVAIAAIDKSAKTLCFAGLGNISVTLSTPQGRKGLASHNGTLGHQMHRIQEFTLPWNENSVLIMHSDGLSNRWDLEDFAGIWLRHPSVIASLLYRDFARERDDVTVLVAKNA